MSKISKSVREHVFDRQIKSGKEFLFAMKITYKDELGTKKKEKWSNLMKIHSNKIGERMIMDISSIRHGSSGGAKFWALFMDDCSCFLINRLLKKKSDLAKDGTRLIKRCKTINKIILSNMRCDNAGKKKKKEEMCTNQGMGVKFEYTAVGMPRQNGRNERKFATLYGKIKSVMFDAGVEEELR